MVRLNNGQENRAGNCGSALVDYKTFNFDENRKKFLGMGGNRGSDQSGWISVRLQTASIELID